MPQVPATEHTSEESQQQLENQETLEANVLDKIKSGDVFKSFDLPGDEAKKPEVQGSESHKVTEEEEQVPEEQAQEEEQPEVQDDIEEDVIPKSKIQPRFDQMTARIKILEQKLAEKEASAPVDDVQRQLDQMTEENLEDALIQTRIAKEESREDKTKLAELVKLERRIEKQIAVAPKKFAESQVSQANKVISRLSGEGEITNDNYAKVLEVAKGIYERYPKMQKTVDGQAMAIELAVDHVKTLGKTTSTKSDNQNLKVQLNNLKKRTSLDTKNIKGGSDKVNLDKLRNTAMTGTMRDKERFAHSDPRFKIDAMIPDHLKG